MTAHIRRSTTLIISAPIFVDTIINAVKLRNAGKAVEKVPIQNKLTRSLEKVKRLYQKLTNNLASRAPLLTIHWGVHVNLQIELVRAELPPKPRRTHWKLNTSILKHESFLPQFTRMFRDLEEELHEFDDAADWWDLYAKPAITSFCKTFSASVAKQRKTFKSFLVALIRVAIRQNNWLLVSQTKEKLQAIIAHEAFGLVIRSRTKQNAEEEAASLYHLGKTHKTGLTKLKVSEDGVLGYKHDKAMAVTEDLGKIEEETVNFMEALLNGRQDQHL